MGGELDARSRLAMVWTILCGESWARFGVAATAGASGGSFLAHAAVARARLFGRACCGRPARAAGDRTGAASSAVPVLLLAGSADPLDPPANLRGWRRRSRTGASSSCRAWRTASSPTAACGCVVARFVDAGSARGLDAGCARHVPLPRFELS